MEPKWDQKRTQTQPKLISAAFLNTIKQKYTQDMIYISLVFHFTRFRTQNGSKMGQKSSQNGAKINFNTILQTKSTKNVKNIQTWFQNCLIFIILGLVSDSGYMLGQFRAWFHILSACFQALGTTLGWLWVEVSVFGKSWMNVFFPLFSLMFGFPCIL